MKTISKDVLKLIESDESDIQDLKDMVDLYSDPDYRNDKIAQHYKNMLKNEYGVDYAPLKKEIVLDLNNLHHKEDFNSYSAYTQYSESILRIRIEKYKSLFNTLTYSDKSLTVEQATYLYDSIGIKFEKSKGNREQLFVLHGSTDTVCYTERGKNIIYLETMIHELGHILDNRLGGDNMQWLSSKQEYASSMYNLNSAEVFAENFNSYFTKPKFMMVALPEVYEELTRIIPSGFKRDIQRMIKLFSSL